MTTKEQYRRALGYIRFVRAYNRARAMGLSPKRINIEVIREFLLISVEPYVFEAAVRTIVQAKYDSTVCAGWTMSNWLLVARKLERLELDTWPIA